MDQADFKVLFDICARDGPYAIVGDIPTKHGDKIENIVPVHSTIAKYIHPERVVVLLPWRSTKYGECKQYLLGVTGTLYVYGRSGRFQEVGWTLVTCQSLGTLNEVLNRLLADDRDAGGGDSG